MVFGPSIAIQLRLAASPLSTLSTFAFYLIRTTLKQKLDMAHPHQGRCNPKGSPSQYSREGMIMRHLEWDIAICQAQPIAEPGARRDRGSSA